MMAAAAGANNNSFTQNTAFADAVQRAKQVILSLALLNQIIVFKVKLNVCISPS